MLNTFEAARKHSKVSDATVNSHIRSKNFNSSNQLQKYLRAQQTISNESPGQPRSCFLQPKLKITQPNDVYEQEADRIAEQATRMSIYDSVAPMTHNKKDEANCKCEPSGVQGEDKNLKISRKPSSEALDLETSDEVTNQINNVLSDSGSLLDSSAKKFMESCFGYDFSNVRIHTRKMPARTANKINAFAYTVGSDIVFDEGQYQPNTLEGRRLLAHELTHVVQQSVGQHHIQRQEAQSKPLRSPGPTKGTPTGEVGHHHVNVVFHEEVNRWLVTIDNIPVAEIAVQSKETPVEVQVDIADSAATVTIRHHGDAALAPVTDPGASLGLSVSLREIEMRESTQGKVGLKEPPVPGEETATGIADIVIAPPSALLWPDEPVGEVSISAPLPPGALSEFEEEVRANSSLINGIVLDPDNPMEVIGYRVFATAGMTRLVDREGNMVFETEIGIETPLVDPLDFIPTPGSVGKVGAGVIGRVGVKALGKKGAVKGTKVPFRIIVRLRGVSKALFGRSARKGAAEVPGFVRKITQGGLDHSFDRHAAEWFGQVVSRETHYAAWRALVERVAVSKQVFPWSLGAAKTIGHLGRVEGKYFVVHFFEETGELASAFVPKARQLRGILKLLKEVP